VTPSDPLKMLQSGLSRLKLVFNGGGTGGLEFQEKEKCKIHPPAMRSLSVVNMRPETTRQLLSKKMSVPVGPSCSVLPTHNPVEVSRSVPNYMSHQSRSPGSCPSHPPAQTSSHRKLTRARVIQPAEILQERRRRERARSASALFKQDLDNFHHGGKRRKQDLNRNIWNADKDSVSSSESNPEDHIYEEIDSDYFDEKETEDNFLLSISLERQRNLKFYGSAGWDFGSVS